MAGPPFARYHHYGPDRVDVEVGAPIAFVTAGLQPISGQARRHHRCLVAAGWPRRGHHPQRSVRHVVPDVRRPGRLDRRRGPHRRRWPLGDLRVRPRDGSRSRRPRDRDRLADPATAESTPGATVSPFRPDLVDCWMFRVPTTARGVERPEILLIRRSPGRILPGLWQCVSGSLEPGERVAVGALRELAEETGFGAGRDRGVLRPRPRQPVPRAVVDAIVTAAVFAVRLRTGRRAAPLRGARRGALARPRGGAPAGHLAGLPDGHRADPRRPVRPRTGRLVRADPRRRPRRDLPRAAEADALVDSGDVIGGGTGGP